MFARWVGEPMISQSKCDPKKIILFANTDWYLWNFRRSLALAVRNAGYKVLLLSPKGDYGKGFAKFDLRWQVLAMDRRSLNPIRELAVVWRLVRLFREEKPTLVHCFTIKCAVYGALAARIAGVPVRISSLDGLGYVFSSQDTKAKMLRPLVRLLFRITLGGGCSRLILLNQDDVAKFHSEKTVKPSLIRLIRGAGVDCARFVPDKIPRNGNPLRVLLAARLLWDKGVAEYIEAAKMLHGDGRNVTFILAGVSDTGNPSAVPESLLRDWVEQGLVEWLGHVDDMAALYRSVDIVVLPSYREGIPTSLTEAAACGLPLVTCDVPGCREVVSDGLDGLLVPPKDAGALASAIMRLIDDSALRVRLGQAARAKVLSEFDERIVIRKTMAVYEELL